MGKNVLLATLLIISVYFGFISNSRSKEVKKQKEIAEANMELARVMEIKALEQEEIATQKAEEARKALQLAEEAIANCK
ncbi:hypothetical protein N6H18_09675 [Reichenbachiella agarivorans]|uniref:Uncharacterized protein n=1 Tax=Reichenbachiella agarivorans TaxID=2979464 RepID=A0ABY6CMB0_9BACT|nr:hypothetical protein [Reichenbachiella agarivorans]UXP30623.1 hypothetical protein N6H18_09675 [Reichenbachiella agarivorans]